MEGTDELREYIGKHTLRWTDPEHPSGGSCALDPQTSPDMLRAIADRIDAEHQKALDEWKAEHGQMWLEGYSECHAEMLEGNEILASDLERCGWMRLPVDADNVPILVGDMMVGEKVGGGYCEPFVVVGYIMDYGKLEPMDEHKCPRNSQYLHHHHKPTVEDVLTEFARECLTYATCVEDREVADAIEMYAPKLQLREDA